MHLQRRIHGWVSRRSVADASLPRMHSGSAPTSEEAWEELFEALPRGWMVGRPPHDPDSAVHRLYAFERRGRRPEGPELAVQAPSEEEALRDLARQLRKRRGSRRP
jgi:hypothetical protein